MSLITPPKRKALNDANSIPEVLLPFWMAQNPPAVSTTLNVTSTPATGRLPPTPTSITTAAPMELPYSGSSESYQKMLYSMVLSQLQSTPSQTPTVPVPPMAKSAILGQLLRESQLPTTSSGTSPFPTGSNVFLPPGPALSDYSQVVLGVEKEIASVSLQVESLRQYLETLQHLLALYKLAASNKNDHGSPSSAISMEPSTIDALVRSASSESPSSGSLASPSSFDGTPTPMASSSSSAGTVVETSLIRRNGQDQADLAKDLQSALLGLQNNAIATSTGTAQTESSVQSSIAIQNGTNTSPIRTNEGNMKNSKPGKRGHYRQYDTHALMQAVQAVKSGQMSVHKAGNYFGVPHSTLEYKVKDRQLQYQQKKLNKRKQHENETVPPTDVAKRPNLNDEELIAVFPKAEPTVESPVKSCPSDAAISNENGEMSN